MGENTGEIEREIRDTRANLGRNLNELEDKARELADWRSHYRSHSALFLGAAFAAGAVIGLSTIPAASRTRTRHLIDADTSHDPYPSRPAARRVSSGNGTVARAMREVSDTWGQIADALLRTASASAIEFVSELIPNFREHVEPKGQDSNRVH